MLIPRGVAQVIGKSLSVKVVGAAEASASELKNIDLLVVDSPTQGSWPTPAIQKFLDDKHG